MQIFWSLYFSSFIGTFLLYINLFQGDPIKKISLIGLDQSSILRESINKKGRAKDCSTKIGKHAIRGGWKTPWEVDLGRDYPFSWTISLQLILGRIVCIKTVVNELTYLNKSQDTKGCCYAIEAANSNSGQQRCCVKH